mgnify:CR=1 FL=1
MVGVGDGRVTGPAAGREGAGDLGRWRGVLRTGAAAAAGSVALIVAQVAVFALHPPPVEITEVLALLQRNPALGLLSLDVLYVVNNVLVALVYLALGVVLLRRAGSLVLVALTLGLLGMAAYLGGGNPAVELLALAGQHADASPAEQAALLAAGASLLESWRGTAYLTYYGLNAAALLLLAVAMLRTGALGRPVGWWALAAGVLMLVPATFGVVGAVFAVASLLPWSVMCLLAARRLWRLAAQPASASH